MITGLVIHNILLFLDLYEKYRVEKMIRCARHKIFGFMLVMIPAISWTQRNGKLRNRLSLGLEVWTTKQVAYLRAIQSNFKELLPGLVAVCRGSVITKISTLT